MSISKQTRDLRRLRRERAALLAVVAELVHEGNDSIEASDALQTYVSVRTIRRAERLLKRITGGTEQ